MHHHLSQKAKMKIHNNDSTYFHTHLGILLQDDLSFLQQV